MGLLFLASRDREAVGESRFADPIRVPAGTEKTQAPPGPRSAVPMIMSQSLVAFCDMAPVYHRLVAKTSKKSGPANGPEFSQGGERMDAWGREEASIRLR